VKPYEHLNGKVVTYIGNNIDNGNDVVVNINYDIGFSIVAVDDPEDCYYAIYGPHSPAGLSIKNYDPDEYERTYSTYELEFDFAVDMLESGIFDETKMVALAASNGDTIGTGPVCQFNL